jgi:pyrroloquinoline quinone biosynthesis protein D
MIDLVPSLVADLETEVIEGEVLLYHPQQTRAVYLNPTAALVFGLCDGKRSVREIIRVLTECYPDDAASLSDDVLTTINELRESGVLAIT